MVLAGKVDKIMISLRFIHLIDWHDESKRIDQWWDYDYMEHATSQEMIDQVAKCPSGALSIKKEDKWRGLSRKTTARKQELKIIPLCPFAKKVFDRDTELQDVRF